MGSMTVVVDFEELEAHLWVSLVFQVNDLKPKQILGIDRSLSILRN
jgi:hypothetical protein